MHSDYSHSSCECFNLLVLNLDAISICLSTPFYLSNVHIHDGWRTRLTQFGKSRGDDGFTQEIQRLTTTVTMPIMHGFAQQFEHVDPPSLPELDARHVRLSSCRILDCAPA
jgi:hypothetical protein